jgi:hypothetical protein
LSRPRSIHHMMTLSCIHTYSLFDKLMFFYIAYIKNQSELQRTISASLSLSHCSGRMVSSED